jgi:hypothetical protein
LTRINGLYHDVWSRPDLRDDLRMLQAIEGRPFFDGDAA